MNLQERQSEAIERGGISRTGKILIAVTDTIGKYLDERYEQFILTLWNKAKINRGVAVGLTAICAPFVAPAVRRVCLPYVPATTEQVGNVLRALRDRPGKVVDLGSGDGRIVVEAAKLGQFAAAHGVELNPWLVWYSRVDALRKGVRAKFFRRDLWKFDMSPYENVVIFGVQEMMLLLEEKINRECRVGTNVVACRFPLPNFKPKRIIGSGIDTVWVYEVDR